MRGLVLGSLIEVGLVVVGVRTYLTLSTTYLRTFLQFTQIRKMAAVDWVGR